MGETTYETRRGCLGGRYVIAKLGNMRVAREWLVQATDDDKIIVQGSKPAKRGYATPYADAIGIFGFNGKGRLCLKGGYFPHLALARPFDFPPGFVRACLEVCQPLDAETTEHGITIVHTVRTI